ncbi:MAG TPA: M48 family metalloprotease [Candidatus Competibacteraceae bacterium]|nr:M48 family metalloprotease [Candidatus Competibacteraceae bacterium]
MNFFEHQDRARRNSRRLVVLFVLAVLAIVAAVDAAVLALFGITTEYAADGLYGHLMETPSALAILEQNRGLVAAVSLGTVALIVLASLYRIASLGAGGGTVARALGGTLVAPDVQDPLYRRLRNVVEEVALACGLPVPQIYVLEQEAGINAFAAGYGAADAAIAVTRGALELLDRDELQGVVAHEFSHILNGDMRLNIRLMGVLFGLLVLSQLGRVLLDGSRHVRVSGRRDGKQGGVALLGLALLLLGWIGVLSGRLIKAAVSRQREFLADAAAVQFTRQPQGIAGALKKIGALAAGSTLRSPRTEEVSHMLFASGLRGLAALFATHPPLEARIKAIDPAFRPAELERIRAQLAIRPQPETPPQAPARPALLPILPGLPDLLPAAALSAAARADLAQPATQRLEQAAALLQGIAAPLYAAAHDAEGAVPLVLLMLLGAEADHRRQRLDWLRERLPPAQWAQLLALLPEADARLHPGQRLPLLELALPALRQRPPEALHGLLEQVEALVHMDGRVTVFEYALGRLLRTHLADLLTPRQARAGGRLKLIDCQAELRDLFAVLAHCGHDEAAAARRAYEAGLARLLPLERPPWRWPDDWVTALDRALARLDRLAVLIKQGLVEAMVATVEHDGRVTLAEAELLRAICAGLHVALPPPLQVAVADGTAGVQPALVR